MPRSGSRHRPSGMGRRERSSPKLWWDGDRTLLHLARGLPRISSAPRPTTVPPGRRPVSSSRSASWATSCYARARATSILTHDSSSTSLVISRDAGQTWTATDVQRERLPPGRPRFPSCRHPRADRAACRRAADGFRPLERSCGSGEVRHENARQLLERLGRDLDLRRNAVSRDQ